MVSWCITATILLRGSGIFKGGISCRSFINITLLMSFIKVCLSSSGNGSIFGGSLNDEDPSGPEVDGVRRDAKTEAGPGIYPYLVHLIGVSVPVSESSESP